MDYCRQRDPAGRGLLHKKGFMAILKSIGLPFTARELLDIAQHYLVPSSEHVDYLTFLKDAGDNTITTALSSKKDVGSEVLDITRHTTVLVNVKRMLADSIRRLNKHPDDVYRMFARWDTQGTGTVTATQLLRVLAKLHVTLTEFDQDFLVELLDTDAMGRIDFDSLLNFCFSDSIEGTSGNLHGSVLVGGVMSNAFGGGDDTLSAVSTDGNNSTEQKSLPSIHRGRPHTATLSRPFNEVINFQHHTVEERRTLESGGGGGTSSPHRLLSSPDSRSDLSRPRALQRPLTASAARTSTAGQFHTSSRSERDPNKRSPTSNSASRHWQAQQDVENHNSYVRERPDDVIDDEEEEAEAFRGGGGLPSVAVRMANVALNSSSGHPSNREDLREQRQPSSQYELVQDGNGRGDYGYSDHRDLVLSEQNPQEGFIGGKQSDYFADSSEMIASSPDPVDHLELLAQQILSTLRDIIITRYRRGKSLQEIFLHFDRSSKGTFDVSDFTRAASDLRIETSDRVATIAVRKIALDGKTNVCFGEFKVFVLDSDHQLLELNIQEQLATVYEQEGRGYRGWMEDVFWSEESAMGDSHAGLQLDEESGFVGRLAFASGLQKIGATLTPSEVTRLVDRFDVRGEDMCSVSRFVRMVRESSAWQHAEKLLEYQEEAAEEAACLRELLRSGGGVVPNGYPQISEELINICEYLGIRVLSEQSMLWIASDALKAPLPISWTAQKDKDGRTYFYNHLSNQARWEHPLDPHFRKLRDKYRQRLAYTFFLSFV
jgi:Ca2+-binding EF-hand superfamily protein